MTGIASFIAGFGRLYRLKQVNTGERKEVFNSHGYKVGTRLIADDWEFEVELKKQIAHDTRQASSADRKCCS